MKARKFTIKICNNSVKRYKKFAVCVELFNINKVVLIISVLLPNLLIAHIEFVLRIM